MTAGATERRPPCGAFPARDRQIRQLAQQSESFSGLCADLAAAERALVTIDQLPAAVRAERRTEFQGLVEGLVAEIDDALRTANIVSISDARRHH